jgi:hypothetical protein
MHPQFIYGKGDIIKPPIPVIAAGMAHRDEEIKALTPTAK